MMQRMSRKLAYQQSYAPIWRRVAAYAIDSVFLAALNFGIFLLVRTLDAHTNDAGLVDLAILTSKLLTPALYVGYFVLFFSTSGRTIGARCLGIRIEATRASLNLGRGLLRFAGFLVGSALFGIGLLWALWDPRRQTWHDKLARTVVVRV